MATPPVTLTDAVRRKALAAGPAGAAWLAALDDLVRSLAGEWGLTVGRTLAGGTEAAVIEARTADGRDAVLKLPVPGQDPEHAEARVLRLAAGRGYANLLRHDPSRSALLLERLGPSLHDLGKPADEAIPAICATLRRAWTVPPPTGGILDGRAKAERLIAGMQTLSRDLAPPLSNRALASACRAAESRARAHTPERAVLAHGDPHAWNTLLVPGSEPPCHRFIDPDGLLVEPAYDLGVLMREWCADLLAGDPVALARARCVRLSALTGIPARPIWEWGTAERVSTGLVLLRIGLATEAAEFFEVAEACADAEPPRSP